MTRDGDALLARYDPFANGTGDVPYSLLDAWRERHPVAELPTGYFFASRYDDVHTALRDGGPFVDVYSHEGKMRALDVVVPDEERLIGEVEGARHTKLRKLLMTALHPSLVTNVKDFLEKLCDTLLDDLLARGEGDLIGDYAVPIPSRVLARVLDLPESDYVLFRKWTVEVVNGPYPTRNGGPFGPGLRGAVPEFADYIDRLADEVGVVVNRDDDSDAHGGRRAHPCCGWSQFGASHRQPSFAHYTNAFGAPSLGVQAP